MKMYCTVVLLFVFCGVISYGEAEAFGTNVFKKEVDIEKGAVKLAREVMQGGYDIITTEELKNLLAKDRDVMVIDTMPFEASFKKGHIPGAQQFLFPIPEMTEWQSGETEGRTQADYASLLGEDKNATIVIYCGFVKCTRSHNGAMWAKKLGYTNVFRHPGGIFAWKGAGYTIEKVE